MPLILKGKTKTVAFISSGFDDLDLTIQFNSDLRDLSSISKAASDMVTAAFSAQYMKNGVLVLSSSIV